MSDANAYQALAETAAGQDGAPDGRWAFGTDPTAGPDDGAPDDAVTADAPVPDGADPADLATYCLMLGDDALVCAQRLCAWVTHAPELEEEVALANIALDLLGQARTLLCRAAHVEGGGRDEDALAFGRTAREFRNVTLAELPDTGPDGDLDFARAIARLLLFSGWRLALFERLRGSRDPVLAAVAARGATELTYHRDHAARWMLRLGDGTPTSHRRAQDGLDAVWPHVDELFTAHEVERRLVAAGIATDPALARADVDAVLDTVLPRATLHRPPGPSTALAADPDGGSGERGGRAGVHTAAFGALLAEMQGLARQHPGASW